jgi:DNA-binding LacI/PurR family transcriptional regulator
VYNRLVDGVISLANFQDLQPLVKDLPGLPWVSCSEFDEDSGLPHASIDHGQAAVDAVQYLINRGHRRIALLGADESYLWARQRHAGYEAALKRAGLPLDPQLVRVARGTDYSFGMEAAGALLALEAPPSAVFAVSDTLAIGAIKAFRRAGRRVPEDIAVVGFDNIPLSQMFEPALTTIAQPMFELGAAAARMLLERLAGGHPQSRTLQHALVVRESA